MKRDLEISRKILLWLETKEDFSTPVFPRLDEHAELVINYHIKLLSEAGLIESKTSHTLAEGTKYLAVTITNEGHDLIASLKQPDVWKVITEKFKESSIDTLKSVAKDLAQSFAKKKVESLLSDISYK